MALKGNSIPTTARALLQSDPASDYKILTLTYLPVPKTSPNTNEHLIRVHSLALCNGELLWPKNVPVPNPKAKELIPGYDIAGIVVEAPDSSPFPVGTEVYGRTNYYRTGSARDYTIALTEELAHRPQRLSWAESAAVPLSSQSAWQALFVHAGLGDMDSGLARGKRILVTAASGGVGAWLIQLGRLAGAEMIGTCGPGNVELVQSLGAKEVLDYHKTNFREWGKDPRHQVDIVIDCIGGKALTDSWWTVRDDGILISIARPPQGARPAGLKNDGEHIKDVFFIMKPNREQLERITELVNEGKCRPVVDSVWRFENYEKAYEKADSGHAAGKVVLNLVEPT